MTRNRSGVFMLFQRGLSITLSLVLSGTMTYCLAEEKGGNTKPAVEPPYTPHTFDKRITDKLGVSNVAYLLAVDVNGRIVPFIPDDPKASFRVIDPLHEKLTLDLTEIAPFTIVAGKRNPYCVIFVGGSLRKLWMESCP